MSKISKMDMRVRWLRADESKHGSLRRFEKGGLLLKEEKAAKAALRHMEKKMERERREREGGGKRAPHTFDGQTSPSP